MARVLSGGRWRLPLVVLAGLLAAAVRIPSLRAPLAPDEAGYLIVASQWHSGGSSLYSDYWVDRPPLLIGFFALAHLLGGALALRVMGCLLALLVVCAAHALGRSVTGRTSLWPGAAAAALVAMPMMGAREVNGELVAAPLVLLGMTCAVRGTSSADSRSRVLLWGAAGVLGGAALMVKQNFADVFVFGIVLVAARRITGQARRGESIEAMAALGAAGAAAVGTVVAAAAARGTTPRGLWDALVVFRFQAAEVIRTSATAATHDRFTKLVATVALSGSLAVVGVLVAHAVRRPFDPLTLAATALLGWELFSVVAGASYWLHYLVGLIPGLVAAVSIVGASHGPARALVRAATVYAMAVAVVTTSTSLEAPAAPTASDRVGQWLRRHEQPGDTAVLLYGNANILQSTGMSSPYPELWSLPVRVRDPNLAELTGVLRSRQAPTWVLAWHDDLSSWGISSARADAVVARRYHPFADVCGVTVYRLGPAAPGSPTPAATCPPPD